MDEFVEVTDAQSFAMTRRLARAEGILTGGSGGMAARRGRRRSPFGTRTAWSCVIIPDSGRGYLSKVFNDEWMVEQGFEVT